MALNSASMASASSPISMREFRGVIGTSQRGLFFAGCGVFRHASASNNRNYHVMKPVFAKSNLFVGSLTCIALLFGMMWNAIGEMPPGLEDALTSYGWSFPGAKAPIHFLSNGTVIDGNGAARYGWDLDKATGTVHLLEKGPKSKDKARIEIWFWNNLTGFSWYDSHGNSSGQGSRIDEAARGQLAATGAPQKNAPLPEQKNAPSAQLQAFSISWLDKLLGPLDSSPLPRAQLMQLQTDYQARLAQAAPQELPTLQAAIQVCATFSNIMDARERARTSLTNVEAATTASVGSTRSAHNKDEKRAQIRAAQQDSAFIASGAVSAVMTHWQEQQKPWRDAVQQLLVREKQAELAALAAHPPARSANSPSR